MSSVPLSYPLDASLGALYGPSILHLLLPLAHHAFMIESNHHHQTTGPKPLPK